jgi:hypothetical protein
MLFLNLNDLDHAIGLQKAGDVGRKKSCVVFVDAVQKLQLLSGKKLGTSEVIFLYFLSRSLIRLVNLLPPLVNCSEAGRFDFAKGFHS